MFRLRVLFYFYMVHAAVDLGNTFGKLSYSNGKEEFDFFKGRIEELLNNLKKVKPDRLIVCSVTFSIDELQAFFKDFEELIILQHSTPTPLTNGYATPATLGYDRLAAAVGAGEEFPGENILIIDMGTALKLDYVQYDGVFKGGLISPGLRMRFQALHTFTKKLPLYEPTEIPELIGDSTENCIKSGVINGMAAEINGIIERYLKVAEPKIIITGGDAGFFESQINYPTFAASNLVLKGLHRILNYNVEKQNNTI
ncbi:type III pantothenate kinase [Jiulongibacter sp. NS-SX5]|uniref:type III pantothenate kinase n=1 Tax=Jiulongibacter sp. NS-SX5 TaxID=3463854 RepID=UPI004059C930